MGAYYIVVSFDVALAALGVWLFGQGRSVPAVSIFGALGILGTLQVVLFSVAQSTRTTFKIEPFFRKTHYVQAMLHTSMYAYLGLYWPAVGRFAPLIVAQILFAYLCDMLLAWWRGRVWRFGFGAVPIVLSTNLFLWFKDEYYFLQLLLIASAFLSKEFITWNYDGRRRHIFNPSAFPLTVASLLLLATGTVESSYGLDIAVAFDLPPNFYEVIFLLGLVVQLLFIVTPVSFGAALSLYLVFLGSKLWFGEPLGPIPIYSAVFLGMTFLVTDPATSPKSPFGRFLFGVAYGTGVTILFIALRLLHQPSFFDKLLIVPILNLMLPWFDRFSAWFTRKAPGIFPPTPGNIARFGWVGAYVVLFVLMDPALKNPWHGDPKLLPPPAGRIDRETDRMFVNSIYCRWQFPQAFKPFGFRAEWENFDTIRNIYRNGPRVVSQSLPREPELPVLQLENIFTLHRVRADYGGVAGF